MQDTAQSSEIVIIGRNCVDAIYTVDRFPGENEKAPFSFETQEGGGQGGTTACCIATLGGRPALIGSVGDDALGLFCLRRLSDFQVATRHVRRVTGAKTPIAHIFVTRKSGKRTILYEPSQLPKIVLHPTQIALLKTAKVVLLDPETTYLAEVINAHKGPQTLVVYDCERWRPKVDHMMQSADFFIPSSDFLKSSKTVLQGLSFSQKMLALRQQVQGRLIVTDGEKGAFFWHRKTLLCVPAPAVPVLDTTGAGDNFHGAFALAIAKGVGLVDSVKLAVAVASLSCGAYGGRNALPQWPQALRTAEKLKLEAVDVH